MDKATMKHAEPIIAAHITDDTGAHPEAVQTREQLASPSEELLTTNGSPRNPIQDRTPAEEARLKSEIRFMDALYSSDDAFLLLDGDKFIDSNEATTRMLGYSSNEEFLASHPSDLSPPLQPDGRSSFEKADEMIKIASEKGFHRFEWMHRKANGENFPVEVSLTPIPYQGRTILHCLLRDLTEYKREEEERTKLLHNAKKRIREQTCIYEVSKSILQRDTLEEIFSDVAALIPAGWQYPELTRGKVAFDDKLFVAEPFEETEWKQASDIIVNGQRCGSVEVYYLQECPELDEGPFVKEERCLIDGIAQSLSGAVARKRAEAALKSSERKLSTITNSALDAVIMINPDGNVAHWNPAAEAIFGYSSEEMLGQAVHAILPPVRFREAATKGYSQFNLVGKGAAIGQTLELAALRKDGSEFPIEISLNAVEEDDGWWAVAMLRDITDRKRAEEEREQYANALESQRKTLENLFEDAEAANRSKSEFLANMSHEIRTPMTAIMGFSEILLGSLTDLEQIDAATTIKRNGKYLIGIINDILDLSKVEAGKLEVERIQCSPCNILSEIISLMRVRAAAKNLPLEIEYDGPIPQSIRSDPTRLRQILINLTSNAIKFTEVGKVRLVVRLLNAESDEPKMQFDVVDSGIGVPVEKADNLFKPFYQADTSTTRKFGGTGLGLTISKRLASVLGGDITIQSTLGKGSTFTLTVATGPLDNVNLIEHPTEAYLSTEYKKKQSVPSIQLNCRVLLAEDGPDNQRLITFLLKKAGAEVVVAENGQIAYDLAMAAQNTVAPFDVILMDMQMPIMDGYTATSKLRESGYSHPIIALTAHAMSTDRDNCLAIGCDNYLAKPIDFKKLVTLVGEYVSCQDIT